MMTTSVSVMRVSECSMLIPDGPKDPTRNDISISGISRGNITRPFIARSGGLCSIARARRPPGSSRSSHGFDRATRRHGAAVLVTQPAAADGLYGRDLRQCAAAVLGAAAVHQNGAAAAWRLAGGVVGGDGVLPVAAARWLCLCAFPDAAPQPRDSRRRASGAAGDRADDVTIVDLERLG